MVTVVMATYNGERYIRQQLDSILNQTYDKIRIVISDDLSADGTPQVIAEYEARFPDRIRSLSNTTRSGGAAANFFRLLRAVSDDYVMLCDQDDVWLPEKVEKTLARMQRMEKKYGRTGQSCSVPVLVYSDLSVVDENLKMTHPSLAAYQKIAVHNNRLNHYLVENNITGSTVMINRAFLEFFSFIPEVCVIHDWWMGLLASSMGRISYIDEPLVLYRQHEGNELGAQKGSMAVRALRRIRAKNGVRENYRRMFGQAGQLFTHYQERLGREETELLTRFLALPRMSRAEKIYTIWKYQLLKSTVIRTVGQMFTI